MQAITLQAYGAELAERIAALTLAMYDAADEEWIAEAAVRKVEDESAVGWSDVCMYCLRRERQGDCDGKLACCEHGSGCCNVAHLSCPGLAAMPDKW